MNKILTSSLADARELIDQLLEEGNIVLITLEEGVYTIQFWRE